MKRQPPHPALPRHFRKRSQVATVDRSLGLCAGRDPAQTPRHRHPAAYHATDPVGHAVRTSPTLRVTYDARSGSRAAGRRGSATAVRNLAQAAPPATHRTPCHCATAAQAAAPLSRERSKPSSRQFRKFGPGHARPSYRFATESSRSSCRQNLLESITCRTPIQNLSLAFLQVIDSIALQTGQ